MILKSIVKGYLAGNGYDGLYLRDCGCKKNELFPCGTDPSNCKPGYLNRNIDEWLNEIWEIGPKKAVGKPKKAAPAKKGKK
jgi:hypothetical protein